MRTHWIAAAVVAAVVGTAAHAQDGGGPYRRFTDSPTDTNRNNRIVYAPIGATYPGPRPGQLPYAVSTASWYLQAPGSKDVRPDKVLDKAEYTLEEFSLNRKPATGPGAFRVVITRRGGVSDPNPELRIVDPKSNITARTTGLAEAVGEGTRYTFRVEEPSFGFSAGGRYELRFMSSRSDAHIPAALVRLPTFGGENPEVRALQPPPQLPRAERVAGMRLEYRSPRSAGRVVVDEKVAGRRQEFRKK